MNRWYEDEELIEELEDRGYVVLEGKSPCFIHDLQDLSYCYLTTSSEMFTKALHKLFEKYLGITII